MALPPSKVNTPINAPIRAKSQTVTKNFYSPPTGQKPIQLIDEKNEIDLDAANALKRERE